MRRGRVSLPPNHATYFVPGLHRGLRVLEILGQAEAPLTLSEIARELGVTRSSAFRIVYTLRHMGFLREQGGAYSLGGRVLNLGFAYLSQQPIAEIARPVLARLRDETGVSAHLSVLEGKDVLYLGSHQARTGYVSNLHTGTRRPAYASPIGWCLLGQFGDAEVLAFCDGLSMPPRTEHTPTTPEALVARVRAAREAGHGLSRGFLDPGGSSLAVPVRNAGGAVVACVSISGPDGGFDAGKVEGLYLPATLKAAAEISRELGHAG
jgi:IclR family transcriptional regulator, pca regulon regulatory protein